MGKTAVVIGNGEFPRKAWPRHIVDTADVIVCCDGGFRSYLRYARQKLRDEERAARARDDAGADGKAGKIRLPDAIVGDMDSLSERMKANFQNIIVKVSEQENNDQTKAFCHILQNFCGISQIFFIACTGKREDHTIGNVSLLMEYAKRLEAMHIDMDLQMISDHMTIFPIVDSTILECGAGRRISLFSPDPTLRIRSKGLQWKTDDVVFDNWWKASLNRASEDTVSLEFSHRSMALVMMD